MCQLKKAIRIALHGTDNTGVYHAVVDGKNNYSIIQAPSLVALNQNAVDAYTHGKFVKTYYEDHFQRHSIDDRGCPSCQLLMNNIQMLMTMLLGWKSNALW